MSSARALVVAAVALSTALGATAQESVIGERDIARPGGAYATLALADAGACARLCARDGLCLAWTQRADGICELKAVIPPPIAQLGARSGLSVRAPDFARHVPLPELARAEPPATATVAAEPLAAPSDIALLGGPASDDDRVRPDFGRDP